MTKRGLELGTAGEHLVAADILLSGFRVHVASAGSPYDLILDVPGRPLIRVAVKATQRAKVRPGRVGSKARYSFHTRRSTRLASGKVTHRRYDDADVDLFAFVALEDRLVGYAWVGDVPSFFWLEAETPPVDRKFGPRGGRILGFADLSLATALEALG